MLDKGGRCDHDVLRCDCGGVLWRKSKNHQMHAIFRGDSVNGWCRVRRGFGVDDRGHGGRRRDELYHGFHVVLMVYWLLGFGELCKYLGV